MALGAERGDVLCLVAHHGTRLAVVGVALGLAGTLALTGLLRGFLFGVSAHDASTLVEVATLLSVVIFLACYLPARRATRIDPLIALRQE
jgi:putative ABC transport system permease protein